MGPRAPRGEKANLEKAIDIKRRAQRCVQNGDLDGALKEYEKLIAVQDSDPYNFVLLADLLYKKGDMVGAAQRYVASIDAYEQAALYKNAIAVGKKMMRLSLSPTLVLSKLAKLHVLDGLGTEAALYYQQYAEHLLRDKRGSEAAQAFRKAFEASSENIKALERLSEIQTMEGDKEAAARTLAEAAVHYQSAGFQQEADRCRKKAAALNNGSVPPVEVPIPAAAPEPGLADFDGAGDGALLVESTHLSSLADDESDSPAEAATPGRLEIEGSFAGGALAGDDALLSSDITHSMELTTDEGADPRTGPPALHPGADGGGLRMPETRSPGLRFDSPADAQVLPPGEDPVPAEADAEGPVAQVEQLLREAREHFRNGERDAASADLVRAAQLYDEMGQFDSAATIYRNLSRSSHATPEVMSLWLRNCESRNDRLEAAQVACELGDRALNDGDASTARDWFRRASAFDANNETAKRRLQKLSEGRGAGVTTTESEEEDEGGHSEGGRVEVAVGRGAAVSFDLGSLVSEFQRGVESQISGDPQGHYDLGMAYREMGLLEQAVEAFRNAGTDPAFSQRCAEMVGRCLLDQGSFDEAAQEFMVALELPGVTPEASLDLRFQLGLAHEAAGRIEAALAEFERVYTAMPSYPDVAQKIRMLRKALESS